jgi:hypothetical protein
MSDRTKHPQPQPQPLRPDEFKFEVNRRGWTYRALAERWGVTENYVSKLARNPERARHWDDAVRGLPTVIRRK